MEKRSHRRFRDLVAHPAFQGLDANEIGCVRISIMAGSNTLRSKGRIQMSETSYLQNRSYPACNTRPVHTDVPGRDSCTAAKHPHIRDGSEHSVMRRTTRVNYSMTSSARTRTSSGTSRPSALAVLMLIMNSIFVGCSTGRSPGFAPLRTLATMTADCRHISARPGP